MIVNHLVTMVTKHDESQDSSGSLTEGTKSMERESNMKQH